MVNSKNQRRKASRKRQTQEAKDSIQCEAVLRKYWLPNCSNGFKGCCTSASCRWCLANNGAIDLWGDELAPAPTTSNQPPPPYTSPELSPSPTNTPTVNSPDETTVFEYSQTQAKEAETHGSIEEVTVKGETAPFTSALAAPSPILSPSFPSFDPSTSSSTRNLSETSTAAAVGVLVGGAALIAGLIVAFLLYRRRRQKHPITAPISVEMLPPTPMQPPVSVEVLSPAPAQSPGPARFFKNLKRYILTGVGSLPTAESREHGNENPSQPVTELHGDIEFVAELPAELPAALGERERLEGS